jgi:hypothetical protein
MSPRTPPIFGIRRCPPGGRSWRRSDASGHPRDSFPNPAAIPTESVWRCVWPNSAKDINSSAGDDRRPRISRPKRSGRVQVPPRSRERPERKCAGFIIFDGALKMKLLTQERGGSRVGPEMLLGPNSTWYSRSKRRPGQEKSGAEQQVHRTHSLQTNAREERFRSLPDMGFGREPARHLSSRRRSRSSRNAISFGKDPLSGDGNRARPGAIMTGLALEPRRTVCKKAVIGPQTRAAQALSADRCPLPLQPSTGRRRWPGK